MAKLRILRKVDILLALNVYNYFGLYEEQLKGLSQPSAILVYHPDHILAVFNRFTDHSGVYSGRFVIKLRRKYTWGSMWTPHKSRRSHRWPEMGKKREDYGYCYPRPISDYRLIVSEYHSPQRTTIDPNHDRNHRLIAKMVGHVRADWEVLCTRSCLEKTWMAY